MFSGVPRVRLVVLDPGLEGKSGHHYALFEAARRACKNESAFEIQFYVHRKINEYLHSEEAEQPDQGLIAHFSERFYRYYKFRPTFAAASKYIVSMSVQYKCAIEDALKKSSQDQNLIFLYPAMQWEHLCALNIAINEVNNLNINPGKISHKVCLMYNPGMDYQGKVTSVQELLAYKLALKSVAEHERLDLYASDFELSTHFEKILKKKVPVHPSYLYDFSELERARMEGDVSQGSQRKIGLYHGDAKAEKGFLKLPAFLEELLSRLDGTDKVFVQFTTTGEDPRLNNAADDLEKIANRDQRVELVRGFLGDQELISQFSQFTEYCFLHDPKHYQDKSSGIAWLVAFFKCPAFIFGESWLWRELFRLCVPVKNIDTAADVAQHGGSFQERKPGNGEDFRAMMYGDFWRCIGINRYLHHE